MRIPQILPLTCLLPVQAEEGHARCPQQRAEWQGQGSLHHLHTQGRQGKEEEDHPIRPESNAVPAPGRAREGRMGLARRWKLALHSGTSVFMLVGNTHMVQNVKVQACTWYRSPQYCYPTCLSVLYVEIYFLKLHRISLYEYRMT